jgi:hypothetical protein
VRFHANGPSEDSGAEILADLAFMLRAIAEILNPLDGGFSERSDQGLETGLVKPYCRVIRE